MLELGLSEYVDGEYKLTSSVDGDDYTLIRETGYYCTFDFAADTICFADYNEFFREHYNMNLVDSQQLDIRDEDGNILYIKRSGKNKKERYGDFITMDLGAYGIDIVHSGKGYYLPLQTANDIFFQHTASYLLYNGKNLFVSDRNGYCLGFDCPRQ